ncbi:MAG TPA: hypothetical protein PK990_01350 [Salinivirgaceae bacterium]|nr:hypothetical protein [Salinivirgaceae bacterium]
MVKRILFVTLLLFGGFICGQVIQKIEIRNNHTTQNWIIHRELLFKAGDTIDTTFTYKIKRSKENLYNTRLFNEIDIRDTIIQGEFVVLITVVERWYIWPYPIFEHADRNLATYIHEQEWERINYGLMLTKYNFRGRREIVNFKIRGGFRQQLALNYIVPYISPSQQKLGLLFDVSFFRQKAFPFDIVNNRYAYAESPSYQYFEYRFMAGLQFRPRFDTRHRLIVTTNRLQLSDTTASIRQSLYSSREDHNLWTIISYQFNHSTLDYILYPTEGYAITLEFQSAVDRRRNSWQNIFFTAQNHNFISYRFIYSGLLLIDYFPNNLPPIGLKQNIGVNYYFRGFEDFVYKADAAVLTRQQLSFAWIKRRKYHIEKISTEKFNKPFLSLYQTIFTDIGLLNEIQDEHSHRFLAALGGGIDLVSYYDIIFRFETVYNTRNKLLFNIHLGSVF